MRPEPLPEWPCEMSGGAGESSTNNLRFFPPCGDMGSDCRGNGGSGASDRPAIVAGVILCHWLDQGGGGGTVWPLDDARVHIREWVEWAVVTAYGAGDCDESDSMKMVQDL